MKKMEEFTGWQLYIIVESSERAYLAIIYVHFCNSDEKFSLNLVTSKTEDAGENYAKVESSCCT